MDVRSPARRLILPALSVSLTAGLVFFGVAMASQSVRPSVGPSAGSVVIAEASAVWLRGRPSSDLPSNEVPRPQVMSSSRPVAVSIRAIGVRSVLNEVGLDGSGAIETPSGASYDEAAWYRHSPTPGSLGPSVILGHIDSATNGPSVFFRLGELTAGNAIVVERADGSVARFTVYAVRLYPKDGFPTDEVYGDTDHAALRLITCGGSFDDRSGHYEDNIVVFARLDPAPASDLGDMSGRNGHFGGFGGGLRVPKRHDELRD